MKIGSDENSIINKKKQPKKIKTKIIRKNSGNGNGK